MAKRKKAKKKKKVAKKKLGRLKGSKDKNPRKKKKKVAKKKVAKKKAVKKKAVTVSKAEKEFIGGLIEEAKIENWGDSLTLNGSLNGKPLFGITTHGLKEIEIQGTLPDGRQIEAEFEIN